MLDRRAGSRCMSALIPKATSYSGDRGRLAFHRHGHAKLACVRTRSIVGSSEDGHLLTTRIASRFRRFPPVTEFHRIRRRKMKTADPKPSLTLWDCKTTAPQIGCTEKALRKYVEKGVIPVVRVGGRIFFSPE